MYPKDADGMANSVDPDWTAPLGAVQSGYALFAQTCLSKKLEFLQYSNDIHIFEKNSLRQTEVSVGRISVCNVIGKIDGAWPTLSAMLLYQRHYISVIVAAVMSY